MPFDTPYLPGLLESGSDARGPALLEGHADARDRALFAHLRGRGFVSVRSQTMRIPRADLTQAHRDWREGKTTLPESGQRLLRSLAWWSGRGMRGPAERLWSWCVAHGLERYDWYALGRSGARYPSAKDGATLLTPLGIRLWDLYADLKAGTLREVVRLGREAAFDRASITLTVERSVFAFETAEAMIAWRARAAAGEVGAPPPVPTGRSPLRGEPRAERRA